MITEHRCFTLRALLIALLACTAGCASKTEPEPLTNQQLQERAVEQRVFYSGWLHPSTGSR
jgi:hypothetical protein